MVELLGALEARPIVRTALHFVLAVLVAACSNGGGKGY
jgi:hypothetical protein